MENYCGKRLDGRYEIREIIGVGGMAVVYKAYDNIDDRIVAVKILKEELLTSEESRRRFKNESKAIAVLSHPNIVRVYDVSFGDRIQYIVMEYVEGITLKEYIEQQGAVNWKEAVHFVSQILLALQHAHDKGIIHRDIKPQNIMLLQDGSIKVADFGIARFSRTDSRTMTEDAIGSVHYISPEQARGEITDNRSDLYSVGVAMYEMLTGQLPFQAENAVSIAIMQLQQEAKPPREINPQIPLGLEQITMRAMQKNPNNRYHSAAEMMLDLDEFKRNPSIKFNYNYFVDEEPTKYVNNKDNGNSVSTVKDETPAAAVTDEEEPKKAVPALVGILAGVVVIIAILAGILLFNKSHSIKVPNFVGMNYTEDIKDNSIYTDNFDFETELVSTANSEAGTVLGQDPDAETKVKKGSTITLKIASNDDNILISGIKGLSGEQAKSRLELAGFEVNIIETYDKNTSAGIVFDSNPAENSYAKKGSVVTIYVSTDENPDVVKVPDVIHLNESGATKFLNQDGFKVVSESRDSEEPAGTVIEQSPKANTEVAKGSQVTIYISTGTPAESKGTINITLPNAIASKEGVMQLEIEGEEPKTEAVTLDGKIKTVEVTGKGTKSFKISLNGQTYMTGKVDFTKNPANVTNVEYRNYVEKAAVPNVVGKSVTDAISTLNNAGFTNIDVFDSNNNPASSGTVVSQTPASDNNTYSIKEQKVTLNVE
ncbi:MAG: Stk1 family PASTA domain-containing Ser/Thr kinase [Ruminococcaceae bacterium]|nr:Stk1 family PASTA domain-containing Ser/Thr kinase [Oscillospiraceae bacterium]